MIKIAKRYQKGQDSLTGVLNIDTFRRKAESLLFSPRKLWNKTNKTEYCLLSIDIDKFKLINNLFGYRKGDLVICFVANQLQKELSEGGLICRAAADNFVLLKKGREQEAISYIEKVFSAIDQKVAEMGKTNYHFALKAGIFQITSADNDITGIIDKANIARRLISDIQHSSFQLYNDEIWEHNIHNKMIESEMDAALREGQFCIYLQPQVSMNTGKIAGSEALVRWIHPKKGIILPGDFIPLFEKNGFITQIDEFVWRTVFYKLKEWKDSNQKLIPISVNMSGYHFQKGGVQDKLKALLDEYKIPADYVQIELTETVLADNTETVLTTMQKLGSHGFRVALDDFGSGYSSLNLLRKIPVDILKLDKNFMHTCKDDRIRDKIIIQAILQIAEGLRMDVIAEGVETNEQADFLKCLGCPKAQGFLYDRPMTILDFENKFIK